MSPVCSDCKVAIAESAILGRYIHVPVNRTEVITVLGCPSYGKPETKPVDDETAELMGSIARWEREDGWSQLA